MASKRICSVDNCGKEHLAKSFCKQHYQAFKRNGHPELRACASRGAPVAFLKDALTSETDDCIWWPYAKHRKGFGLIMYQGKTQVAARVVCAMLHGPPASPDLQAAHSCGNGHLACVNPRHLRWATKLENAADQLIHGTRPRGDKVSTTVLKEQDVLEIRQLFGTMTHGKIAEKYGVSLGTIRSIRSGKNWSWLSSGQRPSGPHQSSHSSG